MPPVDAAEWIPSGGDTPKNVSQKCEFGSTISRTSSGFRDTIAVRGATSCTIEQAGGSCGTEVHDVIVESADVDHSLKGGWSTGAYRNSHMVRRVKRARKRQFKAKQLQCSRGVFNWRSTSQEVMRHLLAFTQCVSVVADIPLCQKSSLHIRSELRSKLATALQQGDKERAFAKSCGFSGKPRANDPEAMMRAYPGIHDIDYSAKPVTSGLNVSLWKFWHARHCVRCTQTEVHKDCYFKPLLHFLNTGFEPPVRRGFDLYTAQPSRVAYVDKWREEEARCRTAFAKWEEDSSGLMSPAVASAPKLVFPLLPVVRAKDAWRHKRSGSDYKVRLCVDFKNGGLNDMLEDWPFRYWGLESVAETVSQGDWLASIDISRFYLRLPAGKNLRSVQWFQDPAIFSSRHERE